jgi:hypothetical protein
MGTYGADWVAAGYCGSGNVAELIGSLKGRAAVICGNADGVFDELERAKRYVDDPVIFAANDAGMYIRKLDHWVTLHADNMGAWKQVRWLHPGDMESTKYHSATKRPFIEYVWDRLTPTLFLSGYFAMQIAYIMGCEIMILAGCPGDGTRRFFEVGPRDDHFAYGSGQRGADEAVNEQIIKEMARLPEFKARVRSMSGWTKQFFGGV